MKPFVSAVALGILAFGSGVAAWLVEAAAAGPRTDTPARGGAAVNDLATSCTANTLCPLRGLVS